MQHLYAVDLLLGEAASRPSADDPVHRALAELDASTHELRRFMQDSAVETRAELATGDPPLDPCPNPPARLTILAPNRGLA